MNPGSAPPQTALRSWTRPARLRALAEATLNAQIAQEIYALRTKAQKELGALVIDIGGGTTEYVVYSDGVIKHAGVLAVGGDHVSNDLAYGLKVPLGRAETVAAG